MKTSFKIGRVEPTEDEKLQALKELAESDSTVMTKAITLFLKNHSNYHIKRVIHHNGKVFAEVSGEDTIPEFAPVKRQIPVKSMSKGWNRRFMGLADVLRNIFKELRKGGRREVEFDKLYNKAMEPYKERHGKNYQPMEVAKFGLYLRDKRLFPGIKYNAVKKSVTF